MHRDDEVGIAKESESNDSFNKSVLWHKLTSASVWILGLDSILGSR